MDSPPLERQWVMLRDAVPWTRRPAPLDEAQREAVAWICRAQDAGTDRGVSHSYALGRGWLPSYPETTGYIIPTLLNWARVSGEGSMRARALEMSDWESRIQSAEGGIQASVVGREPLRPVVFNTGQVVFGWVAAYRETGNETYRNSAARAVAWLMDRLGTEDTWTSHGSMGRDAYHTYNVRVSWAVLEYLRIAPDEAISSSVHRTLRWALAQEQASGWFTANCLTDPERPLLHTIAYTAQGLLESGILIDDAQVGAAARRTLDALLAVQRSDGALAGRFDRGWNEAASWVCLTGLAQTSIAWSRLADLTGEFRYAEAARRANRYLRSRQRTRDANPGIRGAIAGSFPIWGEYLQYRYPNWAAKFYLDALLLETHPSLARSSDYYPG